MATSLEWRRKCDLDALPAAGLISSIRRINFGQVPTYTLPSTPLPRAQISDLTPLSALTSLEHVSFRDALTWPLSQR